MRDRTQPPRANGPFLVLPDAIEQRERERREDEARPNGHDPHKADATEPQPSDGKRWAHFLDFLADDTQAAPELRPEHVPDALHPFINDTAERLGVDATSVALGCIVTCASVISDDWSVQPKRRDYTWTENARLWGAIVGDPGTLKTPIIRACTAPIDAIDAAARTLHKIEMRAYKAALKAAKADAGAADPVRPKMHRYLIENATVDAISEVLRDDDDATQHAPAGKVLSRHDEMGEFFAGLDRYNAGGKGGSDRGAYLRLNNGGPFTVFAHPPVRMSDGQDG